MWYFMRISFRGGDYVYNELDQQVAFDGADKRHQVEERPELADEDQGAG